MQLTATRTPLSEAGAQLRLDSPRRWLVTGAAGFIGSALVEELLRQGQAVVGIDNFATGHRRNVEAVRTVAPEGIYDFREADIRDLDACRNACDGIDVVLHQAALGSVPQSIQDPIATHAANATGFLNVLVAARDAGVSRFVYAASSATYGDDPELPQIESRIGNQLSPYAVTKLINELYAGVFQRQYGLELVGLRYFNVFGRRQDPEGGYAAVIPRWVGNLLADRECVIHGDGETSRDFCYIDNVVQANLRAATVEGDGVTGEIYNVACGERTTLNALFSLLRAELAERVPRIARVKPRYDDFRPGDVRHSVADIGKARRLLGYEPTHTVGQGLAEALDWYVTDHRHRAAAGLGERAHAG